jgi:cyclase
MDRRSVLKAGASGLIAVSVPPLLSAAPPSSEPVLTTHLSDKVAVVSGVGCNVLALSSGDALTLVDCGSAARTAGLMGELRKLPGGKRVQNLFNTHWHPDQTGANDVLARGGAVIIAHEKTKLWLATDHYVPAKAQYDKARPKAAWPSRTFYTSGSLSFGSEHIDYGYLLEAHTDGDCYVFCRDSNVLAVGHVASPVRDPELDWFGGGWIGGRLDALAYLIKLCDAQTRVVPAFGPVIGKDQLRAELDLLQQVYDRAIEYLRKAYNYKEMLDHGVLQGLPRSWSDPETFTYSLCKGLWAHHNMLTHDIV